MKDYEFGKSPVAQVRAALADNLFCLVSEFFPHDSKGTERFRFYKSRSGKIVLTQEFLNGSCDMFQSVVDSTDLNALLNAIKTL